MKTPSIILALTILASTAAITPKASASPHACDTVPRVQAPNIAQRRAQSIVIERNQTIALGGLYRDKEIEQEDQVPVLTKVPYIQRLFRNKGGDQGSPNTIIMVTPTIVRETE